MVHNTYVISGIVQDGSNSIANTQESYTKPSICGAICKGFDLRQHHLAWSHDNKVQYNIMLHT